MRLFDEDHNCELDKKFSNQINADTFYTVEELGGGSQEDPSRQRPVGIAGRRIVRDPHETEVCSLTLVAERHPFNGACLL